MYDTKKMEKLMTKKLMTQKSLAKKAKVAEGTVSRIMITKKSRYDTFLKIAKALDVEPIELLREEGK